MTTPDSKLIQATINGQQSASTAVDRLRHHHSDPDALFLALNGLLPETSDLILLAGLRGFMRTVQKRLERAA